MARQLAAGGPGRSAGWAGMRHRRRSITVSRRRLLSQIDDLKQQIATLQRAAQVDEVATRSLRGTLAQREEELSGLRADLGFYSRLVGGDAQRQGLRLQEVKLQPITGSRGWNLTLSLTQNAKRGEESTGNATVSVEGLRNDKVVSWTGRRWAMPRRRTACRSASCTFNSCTEPSCCRPISDRRDCASTFGPPVASQSTAPSPGVPR